MRSTLGWASLAALVLSGRAAAQSPPNDPWCTSRDTSSLQHLQSLARQYHPDALSPANQRTSQLVAFVLDTACQVLHHTTGIRSAERIQLDSALAALFPGVRTQPFVMAGIADADSVVHHLGGKPWIVWAVVRKP